VPSGMCGSRPVGAILRRLEFRTADGESIAISKHFQARMP